MRSTKKSLMWVVALIVLGAVGVPAAAHAATPTQPVIKDAWVSGIGKVTVQWRASQDASGHAIVYDVYRDVIPVTAATIASRSLTPVVSGYSGTSVQINAAPNETAQSYVWFYAVRARDDQTPANLSPVSLNMSPNMHGYRTDPNIITCPRCHSAHGAYRIDYRLKESCYQCHGGTGFAAPVGAKSTYNTEASFFDTGTIVPGSIHRNAFMASNKKECAACHSPHRTPYYYDASGTYQPAQSFKRMLRVQHTAGSSPSNFAYSTNDNPAGNRFCFACHGSSAVVWNGVSIDASRAISLAGGSGAYAATGGDHNYAGFDSSATAHGSAVVFSNDYDGSSATTDNPNITCLACHAKHASPTDKLIAYRASASTSSTQWAQANLCFACHSSTSIETSVAAGYTKPFAWNGRDVKVQFTNTVTFVSRHPYQAANGTGTWVPTEVTALDHTTASDFSAYASYRTRVTSSDDGEITLDQYARIYGQRGGATNFDVYDPSTNAWSTSPRDNTLWSPATGSSAYAVGGRVYVTRGNSNSQGYYDTAADTWTSATNLPNTVTTGADNALNANEGVTYYSRSGGQSAIMWLEYGGTGTGTFSFSQNLGAGSALAYAPGANRLFIINRNGSSGDGRLYYLASPGRRTGTPTYTQGIQVVSSFPATYHNRMAAFSKNGTEYLMIIGTDTANNNDTIIITSVSGTPAKVELNNGGPFNAALGDGCALVWDGGDYLYAIRGGGYTGFARILIPNNPASATAWGSWQTLANPPWGTTWPAGSSIAALPVYDTSGNATSTEILPPADTYRWGTLTWSESEPANTALSVTVQGWNGASWVNLITNASAGPVDLGSYTTSAYPKLRLVATLTTSNQAVTPTLNSWTVTAVKDVYTTNVASLTCANCHDVHRVQSKRSSGAWDLDRASDPDNTKLTVTSTTYGSRAADFCMRCHDDSAPVATTTVNAIVPYSVGFSSVSAPFFPGWDKSTSGLSFANAGHRTASAANGQALCETCHDPHASGFQRLTAWTKPAGISGTINAGSRENTNTYLSREENLCYQCHGNGTTSLGGGVTSRKAAGAKDVITKVALAYGHNPASATGRHRDTESPTDLGVSNRHAECVDCHDPHAARAVSGSTLHTVGSSRAGGAIYGTFGVRPTYGARWTAPSTYTPVRLAGGTSDFEAYLCFKCHSSSAGSIPTSQTNVALEFNPSNFSYHNVLGQSVGMQSSFTFVDSGGTTRNVTWAVPTRSFFVAGSTWTVNSMLTCTDCHTNTQNATTQASGPHGSSVRWLIDPNYPTDWKTAYLSNTANGMSSTTIICAKCHDLNGPNSTGNWSNNVHSQGDHQGASDGGCVKCHIKVPHGWKRPRLMVLVTSDGAYAGTSSGTTRISVNSHSLNSGQAQWTKNDCTTNCGEHGSISPYWP